MMIIRTLPSIRATPCTSYSRYFFKIGISVTGLYFKTVYIYRRNYWLVCGGEKYSMIIRILPSIHATTYTSYSWYLKVGTEFLDCVHISTHLRVRNTVR